ncbi:MAG: hypothetical protein ACRD88_02280 [Terriglobia bacterium]
MTSRQAVIALFSAALMTGAGSTLAADKPEAAKPGMSLHGGGGMGGMEGMGGKDGMGGMMGMMNMMGTCNRIMQGVMTGHMMPQLPPGNEKLQLQMHAEMMQKMGETLAKYAAEIKDNKK